MSEGRRTERPGMETEPFSKIWICSPVVCTAPPPKSGSGSVFARSASSTEYVDSLASALSIHCPTLLSLSSRWEVCACTARSETQWVLARSFARTSEETARCAGGRVGCSMVAAHRGQEESHGPIILFAEDVILRSDELHAFG